MLVYKGKYNVALVMTDNPDETAVKQIYSFLNHPAFGHTHIAIMPDVHAGEGSVVGYTAPVNDYIIPNVVGVDIGCAIMAIPLDNTLFGGGDLAELDEYIKENIPCGFNIRDPGKSLPTGILPADYLEARHAVNLAEKIGLKADRIVGSIGTLGGGNHFIEVDRTDAGYFWLLIHSGSRNFGLQIAKYYQGKAAELLKTMFVGADAYKGLEYIPMNNPLAEEYLHAMRLAQEYAALNRRVIAEVILRYIGQSFKHERVIDTVHNYISFKDNIIRKGAVSAQASEQFILPFNMQFGSAMCEGLGNKDWNYSAPHGAGRTMSRRKAKELLNLGAYQQSMEGVYTSTANISTIDEAPMAYKPPQEIIDNLAPTATIKFFMKPVYNFKSAEGSPDDIRAMRAVIDSLKQQN
jgi:tRNA-splicing ligase RtcB (3'-phosphate/5'-hydroxy nucleic acid ligase)